MALGGYWLISHYYTTQYHAGIDSMSNNLSTSLYKYTPIKDRMSYNVNIEIYLCLGDTSISYIF